MSGLAKTASDRSNVRTNEGREGTASVRVQLLSCRFWTRLEEFFPLAVRANERSDCERIRSFFSTRNGFRSFLVRSPNMTRSFLPRGRRQVKTLSKEHLARSVRLAFSIDNILLPIHSQSTSRGIQYYSMILSHCCRYLFRVSQNQSSKLHPI